jgi:ribosomal protein S18 acetylase RimI-like enzyme
VIAITEARDDQRIDVAALLARAFVTNPLHVRVFGAGAVGRNDAFFRAALHATAGARYVALEEGTLAGFVQWNPFPGCRLPASATARLMPTLAVAIGVRRLLKLRSWLAAWAACHPASPHVHLGPIAVDPERQGHGIGSALMARYCADLTGRGEPGYLETDRAENVAFYRRHGFEVIEERAVLGVRNYFMIRLS